MAIARSKVTAQGQISVPMDVRRKLGVGPGSVLEWDEDGGRSSSAALELLPSRTSTRQSSEGASRKGEQSWKWTKESASIFASAMRAIDTNVLVRLIVRDD